MAAVAVFFAQTRPIFRKTRVFFVFRLRLWCDASWARFATLFPTLNVSIAPPLRPRAEILRRQISAPSRTQSARTPHKSVACFEPKRRTKLSTFYGAFIAHTNIIPVIAALR